MGKLAETLLDNVPANIGDDDANIAVSEVDVERVRIMLEESETIPPGGQYFGVNGRGFILKPGQEVNVPMSIVDILNSAVMSVPVLDEGQRVIGYRDKLRFPYRVITATRKAA